jgi:hypothetical protein
LRFDDLNSDMPITILMQVSLMMSSWLMHDLKLSVCEIVYQADQSRFELTFYLFQDDLKYALYKNPEAPQLRAKDVSSYVEKHFEWQVNDRQQPMQFMAIREKNDQVAVVFRSSSIPLSDISKVAVSSTILTAIFREQVNMVYAVMPGQGRKVQMLNSTKKLGEFNF